MWIKQAGETFLKKPLGKTIKRLYYPAHTAATRCSLVAQR
jgi:hypothetical protein